MGEGPERFYDSCRVTITSRPLEMEKRGKRSGKRPDAWLLAGQVPGGAKFCSVDRERGHGGVAPKRDRTALARCCLEQRTRIAGPRRSSEVRLKKSRGLVHVFASANLEELTMMNPGGKASPPCQVGRGRCGQAIRSIQDSGSAQGVDARGYGMEVA